METNEMEKLEVFERKLTKLLNVESIDNMVNTPDHIMAAHLVGCLKMYKKTKEKNDHWHS